MIRCSLRRALPLAACIALTACATTRPLQRNDDGLASQVRSAQLVASPHWTMQGRIAVSDGREGGSGRIDWVQDGDSFDIAVRAPVAGGSWRLSGGPGLVQLDGVREQPLLGDDAAQLLARELGWQLPLDQVRAWIRGLPLDASQARVEPDAAGLPRTITEAGWQVEYRAWLDASEELRMPRRLIARKPPYEVRIAVDRWSLHGPD